MIEQIRIDQEQLSQQHQTIIEFLSTVHPFLLTGKDKIPCVEIRPLSRGVTEYDYNLSRSLNLWDLSEKSVERLYKFLELHNGEPYCLYYSVYAYDYDKETYTKTGKKAQKGKITSSAALFTQEIVLDFDHIGEKEWSRLSEYLEQLNIEGIWVKTGHGYQLHILLKQICYDLKLLDKMVEIFRAKGFDCDEACIDSSRIMRLPETFNCKCFADETYHEESAHPPYTQIVQMTQRRYDIEYIISNYIFLMKIMRRLLSKKKFLKKNKKKKT